MARRPKLKENFVVSVRLEKDMYEKLQDISALHTLNTRRQVSVQQLIRDALFFVYEDNENLRESFRRARDQAAWNYIKKYPCKKNEY